MIKYIRNKQIRLVQSISLDFIRDIYMGKLISPNRLVGLVGQRGVGKTTLLLQYLKSHFKPSEYLYFSADDVYIINSSIYDISEEFVKLGGKVIVIDEIHKYKNWAIELKSIYDSFPDLIVRFSGSSMLNILSEKYDLSRRCVTVYVTPLSFREYLKLSENIEVPALTLDQVLSDASEISSSLALENPTLYKSFLTYLQIGFYPFFIEDEVEYKNKLFNALDKIIAEDIPSLNKIEYTHLSIFRKFIAKLIYARVPYQVNITALSKEFGISHPTLSSYLSILEATKIIKAIKKYSSKISKKPEKLLFSNTNILYTFADEFGIEVDIGTVRETFFASCFEKIYYSDIGDFRVDEYIFEIGGKNKSFKQIKDIPNSFVVVDTDYSMEENKIPLWLFGLIG
ncbi:MAG TPA: ATP-binding protein [Campylobacterales bacterium]|nr:ATP-binding protein [Campylobacterales bacterium]